MSVRVADEYNISYSQANDVRANAGGTVKRPMGIYIPAYWGTWKDTSKTPAIDYDAYHQWVLNYIRSAPDINFIVAINPNSGYYYNNPGSIRLVERTWEYQQAGAKVLGYISVNYGTQNKRSIGDWGTVTWDDTSLPKLKEQAAGYLQNYWIDGYMLDDHPSVTWGAIDTFGKVGPNLDTYSIMKNLNDYMKSIYYNKWKRMPFIKANVGTKPAEIYYSMYANINIWEAQGIWGPDYWKYPINNGYPTKANLQDRMYWKDYRGQTTLTLKFSPFNETLMNNIAYTFKYLAIHEAEYTFPANSLPQQIKWCQKYW